jgi:hypothetical protein
MTAHVLEELSANDTMCVSILVCKLDNLHINLSPLLSHFAVLYIPSQYSTVVLNC